EPDQPRLDSQGLEGETDDGTGLLLTGRGSRRRVPCHEHAGIRHRNAGCECDTDDGWLRARLRADVAMGEEEAELETDRGYHHAIDHGVFPADHAAGPVRAGTRLRGVRSVVRSRTDRDHAEPGAGAEWNLARSHG